MPTSNTKQGHHHLGHRGHLLQPLLHAQEHEEEQHLCECLCCLCSGVEVPRKKESRQVEQERQVGAEQAADRVQTDPLKDTWSVGRGKGHVQLQRRRSARRPAGSIQCSGTAAGLPLPCPPAACSPAARPTCLTQIVACASLFLAGKVNDQPVHHHKVANTMLKAWYNRENPQLQQLAEYAPGMDAQKVALLRQQRREQHLKAGLPPPKTPPPLTPAQQAAARSFWTDMYDAVLEAERALLYTVGFDFNIDIIHTHLARLLNRPRFDAIKLKENLTFQQYAINMANDIYGKDAMLVLEVRPEWAAAE